MLQLLLPELRKKSGSVRADMVTPVSSVRIAAILKLFPKKPAHGYVPRARHPATEVNSAQSAAAFVLNKTVFGRKERGE